MCSGEKTGFLVEMSFERTVLSYLSWISFLDIRFYQKNKI